MWIARESMVRYKEVWEVPDDTDLTTYNPWEDRMGTADLKSTRMVPISPIVVRVVEEGEPPYPADERLQVERQEIGYWTRLMKAWRERTS